LRRRESRYRFIVGIVVRKIRPIFISVLLFIKIWVCIVALPVELEVMLCGRICWNYTTDSTEGGYQGYD